MTALAASQSAEDGLPVTPSYVAEKGVASTAVLVTEVGPSVVPADGAATGGFDVGAGDEATGEACGASVATVEVGASDTATGEACGASVARLSVGKDVVAMGGCIGAATGATLNILTVGSDVSIWNTGCWMGVATGISPLVGETKGCGDVGESLVGDLKTG